jgi:hypothetical protein
MSHQPHITDFPQDKESLHRKKISIVGIKADNRCSILCSQVIVSAYQEGNMAPRPEGISRVLIIWHYDTTACLVTLTELRRLEEAATQLERTFSIVIMATGNNT